MRRRLIIRPEAEADIKEAAIWYEARERGLGLALTLKFMVRLNARFSVHLSIYVYANVRTFVASS
jgi:L-amino acid N-acyltransferase YncA